MQSETGPTKSVGFIPMIAGYQNQCQTDTNQCFVMKVIYLLNREEHLEKVASCTGRFFGRDDFTVKVVDLVIKRLMVWLHMTHALI